MQSDEGFITSRNMQLSEHMQFFFFQQTYTDLLCPKILTFSSTAVGS